MSPRHLIKDLFKRAVGVDALEAEVRSLRHMLMERIEAAGPRPTGIAYDLVRLGIASFFVPSQDNLYNIAISDSCKHFTIARHIEASMSENAQAHGGVFRDVTQYLFAYLDVLFKQKLAVEFYDIGAWVGDIAIRMACFAKLQGGCFHADCFDPSLAGTLIPFNIELNDVADCVCYRPIGVSVTGGPAIFTQLPGHSDAARLDGIGTWNMPADSYLIRTVTLGDCLREPRAGSHQFVKIDVEGIDGIIVRQHRRRLDHATLAIEFAPDQKQYIDIGAIEFIGDLLETHSLLDLFYLPRPTMAERVTDPSAFVKAIRQRRYGYTDILAIPRSLDCHDELLAMTQNFRPIGQEYLLA